MQVAPLSILEIILFEPRILGDQVVLSGPAGSLRQATNHWALEHQRPILRNDPELAERWPLAGDPPQHEVPCNCAEVLA